MRDEKEKNAVSVALSDEFTRASVTRSEEERKEMSVRLIGRADVSRCRRDKRGVKCRTRRKGNRNGGIMRDN